jgi:flagellar hook assembly protein FlgD
MPAGAGSIAWDGRTPAGAFVPDGTYTVSLRPVDRAGNRGSPLETAVVAYGALGFVKTSVVAFHARDNDRLARTTTFTFKLRVPATVTWRLLGPGGVLVATRYEARAMAAGTYGWTWDGRLPDGSWARAGVYTSRVEATDGTTSVAQAVKVTASAFRLSLSDTTPSRGQRLTATVTSTEPLRSNPRIIVTQPGRPRVIVFTTRIATNRYRVTFRLSAGGQPGTLTLRPYGYDTAGGYNWSSFDYPVH